MPPKSNIKNVVIFFTLSALTLVVFVFLQKWLEPPPVPIPPEALALQGLSTRAKVQLVSGLVAMRALPPAVPGVGALAQLQTDAYIARYLAKQDFKTPSVAKVEPKPAPPPPSKPVTAGPPAKRSYAELGGDDYKLRVKLTSHGAGVEELTLTRFRAADEMGRPEKGPLVLVLSAENQEEASNVMFHYARPGDDRPLDTLAISEWTLDKTQSTKDRAVFYTDLPDPGVRITKTFTLKPDEYHLGLEIKIELLPGKEPFKFRYMVTSGHGLPIEGIWYTTIYRNAVVGRQGERGNFSRDLETSQTISHNDGGNAVNKPDKELIRWAGVTTQYFESLLIVDNEQEKQDFLERTRPKPLGERNLLKPSLDDIVMRVVTQPLEIKNTSIQKYLLYYGPVKVALLGDMASAADGQGVPKEVLDRYIGGDNSLRLDKVTDYGNFGFWTQILVYVTNFMQGFLDKLHYVIPNYGVCIILLTLLVRGLMHPISRKQAQTSVKMQAIMPEVKQLQEKHKGDRQALAREQMALYRKHGVHPLGSCWVIFLQMPIFLGLYYALQESVHFRLSPFLWVKNLAAPDMLIWWTDRIPMISAPENQGSFLYLGPYFNLLPVVAVVLMMIQQKYLTPPPTDETQAMQFKMMKYMMVFMGLMFYKVAAGLCVYFIVSSVWGVAERKLLPKPKRAPAGAGPAEGKPLPRTGPGSAKPPRTAGRKEDQRNGDSNGPFRKLKEMWAGLLREARKK